MKLDDSVIRRFSTAKSFKDFHDRINSLDFTTDGQCLVASSADDSIAIYDCQTGTRKHQIQSKKYGVDVIRFAHQPDTAIHGSTKIDDTIRYVSLLDNKYICYFIGHTKKVTQISVSRTSDIFVSGSLDKTVRIWDLKSQNCQSSLPFESHPLVAIDPEGLIFVIGLNSETVKMYDFRTCDKAPFLTMKIPRTERDMEWTGLKFSPNGHQIMVTTNKSCVLLLDSFNGQLLHTLTGHFSDRKIVLEASYSPDSAYVFSGSKDGKIFVWSAETGRLISTLSSMHNMPIECLVFNPKQMLLATSIDENLCLWLPRDLEDD